MNVQPNEILLIYNSKKMDDRKSLGYAKSLQHHKVKELDVQKESLTELQLKQVAERLKTDVKQLIDKTTKEFQEIYHGADLSPESVVKAISSNPLLMKTPIAIYDTSAEFVSTGYTFIKRDMTDGKTTSDKIKKGDLKEN